MKKSKKSNGAFWGTIVGTSLGVLITSQMTPMNKRKMKRTARKASENIKNMMD